MKRTLDDLFEELVEDEPTTLVELPEALTSPVSVGQVWARLYVETASVAVVEVVGLRDDGIWVVTNHGGPVEFIVPMAEEYLLQNYARVDGLEGGPV